MIPVTSFAGKTVAVHVGQLGPGERRFCRAVNWPAEQPLERDCGEREPIRRRRGGGAFLLGRRIRRVPIQLHAGALEHRRNAEARDPGLARRYHDVARVQRTVGKAGVGCEIERFGHALQSRQRIGQHGRPVLAQGGIE